MQACQARQACEHGRSQACFHTSTPARKTRKHASTSSTQFSRLVLSTLTILFVRCWSNEFHFWCSFLWNICLAPFFHFEELLDISVWFKFEHQSSWKVLSKSSLWLSEKISLFSFNNCFALCYFIKAVNTDKRLLYIMLLNAWPNILIDCSLCPWTLSTRSRSYYLETVLSPQSFTMF